MFPKRIEFDDPKYRAYLHSQRCFVTNLPRPIIAHIRIGAKAGGGEKPQLYDCLPILQTEHEIQHQYGEVTYWRDAINTQRHVLNDCLHGASRLQALGWLNTEGRGDEALALLTEWWRFK